MARLMHLPIPMKYRKTDVNKVRQLIDQTEMRTFPDSEILILLEAVAECRERLKIHAANPGSTAASIEFGRLAALYSLLPIDQLIERIIEANRKSGAA